MRQYIGNGSAVTAISFINYSHFLMAGYEDGSLSVYQTSNCKRVALVHVYNSDKNTIMSISEDGHIKIWEFIVNMEVMYNT